MKQSPIKNGVFFASCAMLLIFGCHKQKPPIPQEPQPPAISQQPQQQPQTQPTPTQTPSTTTEQPQTATSQPPPDKPAPAHHPRPHPPKKNGNEKPATANDKPAPGTEKPAGGNEKTTEAKNIPPPRVVIQEGGTNGSSAQMSSGQRQEAYNQTTTEQLLDGTAANLRNIKPQLSAEEQSMLSHIRDFVTQSQQATKDGDAVRAHTLALKARLLSDELVKAR
jgi:hypothetical protein